MSLDEAPFTAKAIAPFLERTHPDVVAACERATSLVVNMRDGKKVFGASQHLIEPLLALLPHQAAAAEPLATFADHLTRSAAYPEATACIDAVIETPTTRPLGNIDSPWNGGEPMTWARQQALMWLWRGECRFASGDRDGGEAAFTQGTSRAEAATMPAVFGLLGSRSPFQGTVADRRLWALVRGARALRLRFEGKDACDYRTLKKKKTSAPPDAALLAQARTYLDDALAVIAPRAAEQYAGVTPQSEGEASGLRREHTRHAWQRFAYFESALVDEHRGDLSSARLHLGRAKWISALSDPTHRHEAALLEAVARLGADNVPLA